MFYQNTVFPKGVNARLEVTLQLQYSSANWSAQAQRTPNVRARIFAQQMSAARYEEMWGRLAAMIGVEP